MRLILLNDAWIDMWELILSRWKLGTGDNWALCFILIESAKIHFCDDRATPHGFSWYDMRWHQQDEMSSCLCYSRKELHCVSWNFLLMLLISSVECFGHSCLLRDITRQIGAWTRIQAITENTLITIILSSCCSSCTVEIYTVYPRTNWLLIREEESNWSFIVPNGICWTSCRPFVFNGDCSCSCHLVDYGLLCLVSVCFVLRFFLAEELFG